MLQRAQQLIHYKKLLAGVVNQSSLDLLKKEDTEDEKQEAEDAVSLPRRCWVVSTRLYSSLRGATSLPQPTGVFSQALLKKEDAEDPTSTLPQTQQGHYVDLLMSFLSLSLSSTAARLFFKRLHGLFLTRPSLLLGES